MLKSIAMLALVAPMLLAPGVAAQTVAPAQPDTAQNSTDTSTRPVPASITATDGPGVAAHFDPARKDCFGTARNTSSKVWYTLANGVLSDVYYPTIDNTNVETLQYIVTDGATFTDLQSRDMTYTVSQPDARSLGCEITSTANSGKYQIVSRYIADPGSQTVLVDVRFKALIGNRHDYSLYVRLDPTINGNGGGAAVPGSTTPGGGGSDSATVDTSNGHAIPVACDTNTTTNAVNRDYAQPVCSALDSATPWLQVSNGFAGQPSDALVQLDTSHRITSPTTVARSGNVVQTTQVDLRTGSGESTLALGFGKTPQEAASATRDSLRSGSFKKHESEFDAGWRQYDAGLVRPPNHFQGVSDKDWDALVAQYYLSLNAVKASEDKTFPGAVVASIASPWGQAIVANDPNNTYFGSYREVFARDVYEAWTGLLVGGDTQTARDIVTYLFTRQQQPDGSFPRNSLLNGLAAPDTFNIQLDECSYPILMAWQLGMTDASLYTNHVKPAADFVISHGPSFGPERWEEQGGFSPSTISAEVAGLISAADIADVNHDAASAAVWRGVADSWQRQLEGWTVTTNGPLASHPYFIRLSKTGDPNAAISYGIGNGGPTLDQRTVIDAGFLELVRLGLVPASDPNVVQSLPVVDATIMSSTPTGVGWHRYNSDGYGDRSSDGRPWAPSGQGTGHLWPVLSNERGEYDMLASSGPSPISLLRAMHGGSSGVGLVPEQIWEQPDLAPSPFGTDPTVASIGFQDGHPAGSAAPLTWAAAVYARLLNDMLANKLLEQPTNTVERYLNHQQAQTTLTLTSPADASSTPDGNVTVAGTTAAGNSIAIVATNIDTPPFGSQSTTAAVSSSGSFSVPLTVSGGTTVISVVATSPSGATEARTVTVVFDFTPGTVLLDVTDPSNDDTGPGNYAYPTAADFHAGAFDIQEFVVIDDGTNVTFKLKTRDLSPTFGSPLGAQLVDVYVHTPNAAPADTSTAASFPQRNYQIAPTAAWSRLIEVQGFGQRYIDAHNSVLGQVTISANAISRFITFRVPESSLGKPGSGWSFSVVLTGQDGFSPDQARGFAATPQQFAFGVCAAASLDPHCTVDPTTVPKAVDVLTPPGVQQSDELDYTRHTPVVIQAVTMP